MDEAVVSEVESAAYRSWQAEEVAEIAGWRLHAAGGFSRRVNSAAPTAWAEPTSEALGVVRAWYAERGLELIVRVTPLTLPFDKLLEERGFTREGTTDVMTSFINGNVVFGVHIDESPSPAWMSTQARLQQVPDGRLAAWEGIIGRISTQAAFASIGDTEPVATGLGIRYGRWVGLFEINVDEGHRQRGLGRRLSEALLSWGASRGATRSYLQVVRGNNAARALYRSLGFTPAYEYWYRRAPA